VDLGSQGGVFAETPNRIYIANRGELPIPDKAPEGYTGGYGAFGTPATNGKPRMEHCILVVDGNGKLLEDWTQWDHLFAGGRGPHHVKISPYDPEKHVWVVDDMVQQVFEFTHDGKQLVMTLGGRAAGAGTRRQTLRPPHGYCLVAGRNVLRQRRLCEYPRGEVRQKRQIPDGLGDKREGAGTIRSAAFDRYR
jgi:hypothetical protein